MFVKVAEAEDVSEDPPIIEVGDGIAEGKEEGGRSREQVAEPIGHGLGRRGAIDRGGIDVSDIGFDVGSVLGG